MNKPVSVIIPTFNRVKTIANSIQSVLEQSYENLEIVVIDDGSTDDTESLVNEIIEANRNKIRYFKLDNNHGAAYARNFGVNKAKYDIIAFNDSDDLWHSDKLEKQMNFLSEHPDSILVYCAYALKHNLADSAYRKVPSDPIDSDRSGETTFLELLYNNTIGTPTMLLNKKAFLSIGGFDTSMRVLEDWDLAVKLAIIGKIRYQDEILVSVYAAADENRMSFSRENLFKYRCKMLSKYKNELAELNILKIYIDGVIAHAERFAYTDKAKEILKEYEFGEYL